ncbi:NAD(P)H-binding protein [Streptomyces sp. TRM 70361]|uniref:SDR family oxidoreductase n=1 Tax=Streptomyces sp. TRM 70361 TaxID=3116553 RepID=UPI002E7C0E77|nr:NAD(P)H-binding protein [Streptomyces sp. TRM 70361]MEE1941481.1 NAD(P)H-binding protein [Streptomyces sp. TRM 70361]
MRIAIVGGTGTLGRQVADELRARGHEVRVLSRASTGHPVDLTTGRGLRAALEGCDTVVDTADAPTVRQARRTLVEGSRRLLGAGAEAGVGHHVCVSVVGCDRVPAAYYRVKTEQERVVANGPVPWTVVRATQFHEYVAGMLDSAGRWRVLPVPRARIQPVAVTEVARAVTGRYALPLPLPGGLGRALRAGGATTARPDVRGSVPFAVWLGERR